MKRRLTWLEAGTRAVIGLAFFGILFAAVLGVPIEEICNGR